jgi:hypothetical protein
MPEPMPRPTRFLLLFAFFGALRFDRFVGILFLAQRRQTSDPADSLVAAEIRCISVP